jgi:hypothetical protein
MLREIIRYLCELAMKVSEGVFREWKIYVVGEGLREREFLI